MSLRPAVAVGTALAGGLLAAVVTAGPAVAACDAYSGRCVEPPAVLPTKKTRADVPTVVRGTSTPSTLPFTGGELVLVSVAGAGALAGGAALVVAGRRRGDARA